MPIEFSMVQVFHDSPVPTAKFKPTMLYLADGEEVHLLVGHEAHIDGRRVDLTEIHIDGGPEARVLVVRGDIHDVQEKLKVAALC
jgi:hypothetical protein